MDDRGERQARLGGVLRPSLARNVGIPIIAALVLNGIIFAFGLERSGTSPQAPFAPPGAVVGGIWIVLLALMGLARWRLSGARTEDAHRAETWVTILIAACLAYPLYTAGFSDTLVSFVGSAVTVLLALVTVVLASRALSAAGWFLLPTLAWSLYALAITFWNVRHM